VTFAYPIIFAVVERADPRALGALHRAERVVGQRLISPGLAVVLLAGIYLASKLHEWSAFYVQWGLAVAIVLGALSGMFFAPIEKRLAEVADRDVAAATGDQVTLSAEYQALSKRLAMVGALSSVLVLITIYFMVTHTGA
jgi:Mg2+/Co2+ transporter CorB